MKWTIFLLSFVPLSSANAQAQKKFDVGFATVASQLEGKIAKDCSATRALGDGGSICQTQEGQVRVLVEENNHLPIIRSAAATKNWMGDFAISPLSSTGQTNASCNAGAGAPPTLNLNPQNLGFEPMRPEDIAPPIADKAPLPPTPETNPILSATPILPPLSLENPIPEKQNSESARFVRPSVESASPVTPQKFDSLQKIYATVRSVQKSEEQKVQIQTSSQRVATSKRSSEARIEAARLDLKDLSSYYQDLPVQQVRKQLRQSFQESESLKSALASATGTLSGAEKNQAVHLLENARDQSKYYSDLLAKIPPGTGDSRKLSSLINQPKNAEEKKISEEFKGLLAPSEKSSDPNANSLTQRMLLLNGLPPADQARLTQALRQKQVLDVSGGKGTSKVAIPGNETLRGQGSASCTDLLSRVVSTQLRKTDLNSLDLWGVGVMLRTGTLPIPPIWKNENAEKLQRLATYFQRIYLQKGESLLPGDIVVYRLEMFPNGQIYVIEKFDPKDFTARVWQFQKTDNPKSASTKIFLSVNHPETHEPYLRPGVLFLRIRDLTQENCKVTL